MRIVIVAAALSLSLISGVASPGADNQPDWKQVLNSRLPLYGHRNWIVVTDSAYPAQAREGIETVVSGADAMEVLQYVDKLLSSAKHVRPTIFFDRELQYVPEADAPGITAYRTQLEALFDGRQVERIPHDQLIAKLDAVARTFRILIVKTNLTLPYTSVFFQLDCAYWPPDAEKRLRDIMARQK